MTEATPKRILQRMDVKELNIAHIKSHLQVTLIFFIFFFNFYAFVPIVPEKYVRLKYFSYCVQSQNFVKYVRVLQLTLQLKRIDLNFNSEIVICNLI